MPENLSASSSSESDEESQRSSTDQESFSENRHDEENFGKGWKKGVSDWNFRVAISESISPREGSRYEGVHSSGIGSRNSFLKILLQRFLNLF